MGVLSGCRGTGRITREDGGLFRKVAIMRLQGGLVTCARRPNSRKDKERKGMGTHVVKTVIDKVSDQHLHLGRGFAAMGQILSGHSSISDMLRTTVSQC